MESREDPTSVSEVDARPRWRIRGSWADRLEVVLPVLGYLAMVVSGMTTSSLGLLRVWPGRAPGGMLGEGLPIRSDEWLTAAPIELGTLANGSSMHSPLAHGPDLIYQVSSGSPIESVLFLEGNLLRLGEWLPDAMLFAAFRGYHWLLLALFLPPLLRRMGANRPMSWLAVVLCFLAPASIWWSFMPIRILGLAAAGCYFVFLASDRLDRRHWVRGLLLAAVSGLFLARLVTYYVPWSLTVGVPLVAATGFFLVRERAGRRGALVAIGAGATVALALLLGLFWENWGALHAELNTIYPGQRRTTGTAQAPFQLFGGPGLFSMDGTTTMTNTNQSEASSAYLLCALVAVMLWPAVRRGMPTRDRAAVVALGALTAVLAAWAMFDWGALGRAVPGLNTLMPVRGAQTVGYPATILMCLVLSAWARQTATSDDTASAGRRRLRPQDARALTVAAVVAVVTAYGVSNLHTAIVGFPAWQVWLATVVTGALVWAFVRYPRHWAPVAVAALVGVVAYVDANPIMFGLGDLRTSPAADRARAFRAENVADGTVTVTDTMAGNALMVANGVPSLGGYQVTGPSRDDWAVVDPTGRYENVWNRGASYLMVVFDKKQGELPELTQGATQDFIVVHADACWLANSSFHVSRIVSQGKVNSPCARRSGKFTWNGFSQFVYRLTPA